MEYGSTNYFVQRKKQDIIEMQKYSTFHGTHKNLLSMAIWNKQLISWYCASTHQILGW